MGGAGMIFVDQRLKQKLEYVRLAHIN